MKKIDNSAFLWTEKYRPQTIDDCILSDDHYELFKSMIEKGESQNLLISGIQGVGKSSCSRALSNDLNAQTLMINTSDETGIDTLRHKIREFASTVSIGEYASKKIAILDEFDYASGNFQAAMRGFIEQFSSSCRFILTCNYKNKIIPALHSRFVSIDFNNVDLKSPIMMKKMYDRLIFILNNEKVEYDKNVVRELLIAYTPDFRKVINELQRYASQNGGKIDTGILGSNNDGTSSDKRRIGDRLGHLITSLKKKSFKDMRRWIVENPDVDSQNLYRSLYDEMNGFLESASIPQLVLILAEAQYKSAFVADPEIHNVATCTEIMMKCKFK